MKQVTAINWKFEMNKDEINFKSTKSSMLDAGCWMLLEQLDVI